MSGHASIKIVSESDSDIFSTPAGSELLSFWWLGQAGFAFLIGGKRILVDPYLSDSLAKKYKDKEFPHKRMMPIALRPEDMNTPDWVLVSHKHTDHMDPETLVPLARINPDMKIILPAAWYTYAIQLGLNRKQICNIDAGEQIILADGLSVEAIPSAHERIEKDRDGNHLYLGYIIRYEEYHVGNNQHPGAEESVRSLALYHSGDCIPFPGLTGFLRNRRVDLAFLPVNGRDSFRREKGIPGNFTLAEAVKICRDLSIPWLIPQHFGMFEFNSIPKAELIRVLKNNSGTPDNIIPEMCVRYSVKYT